MTAIRAFQEGWVQRYLGQLEADIQSFLKLRCSDRSMPVREILLACIQTKSSVRGRTVFPIGQYNQNRAGVWYGHLDWCQAHNDSNPHCRQNRQLVLPRFVVRKQSNTQRQQTVFSLNENGHFSYGVYGTAFFISICCDEGNKERKKVFTSSFGVVSNNWSTIGLTYKDGKLEGYVDSNLVISENIRISKLPDFGEYTIGAESSTDLRNTFSGYIDDIFVTGAKLNSTQIQEYCRSGFKTFTIKGDKVVCVINKNGKKYHVQAFGRGI